MFENKINFIKTEGKSESFISDGMRKNKRNKVLEDNEGKIIKRGINYFLIDIARGIFKKEKFLGGEKNNFDLFERRVICTEEHVGIIEKEIALNDYIKGILPDGFFEGIDYERSKNEGIIYHRESLEVGDVLEEVFYYIDSILVLSSEEDIKKALRKKFLENCGI